MSEFNNVHDSNLDSNYKIYEKKYNKENIPENYLKDLENFLKNNQLDNDNDYSELRFSQKDHGINDIRVCCLFYSKIDNNLEFVINNCINILKEKNEINNNELIPILSAIDLVKKQCNENSTYNITKEAIFLIISTGFGSVMPMFIDDIGLKFRLENLENKECFDSYNYLNSDNSISEEQTPSCII